jgi:hypothetical protein
MRYHLRSEPRDSISLNAAHERNGSRLLRR